LSESEREGEEGGGRKEEVQGRKEWREGRKESRQNFNLIVFRLWAFVPIWRQSGPGFEICVSGV
jgi:hypothetical protein